jgi:toxin secretion/phage lysis holin
VVEMKNDKSLQAIMSAALAAFAVYMGALAVPIIVLMVMMIIDYLSGMSVAWVHGDLSSKVGAKGIVKKVGYMALIVVAMGVDYLIYSGITAANITVNYNMWFGLLVAVWLIINEMISILENLSKLGVPIPDF